MEYIIYIYLDIQWDIIDIQDREKFEPGLHESLVIRQMWLGKKSGKFWVRKLQVFCDLYHLYPCKAAIAFPYRTSLVSLISWSTIKIQIDLPKGFKGRKAYILILVLIKFSKGLRNLLFMSCIPIPSHHVEIVSPAATYKGFFACQSAPGQTSRNMSGSV